MNPYQESVDRFHAYLRRELFLGRGAHTGRLYFAKLADYLASHCHLIGASNFGKSFFLEHLLRMLTELLFPASLIDPHGDRARSYLAYLQRQPRLTRERRILHLAPGSPHETFGLNPFDCGLTDPGEVASLLLEALIQRVFGRDSLNESPLLERTYRATFHTFAANQLDLTQAGQFLAAENRAFRDNLLAQVADEQVKLSWQEIERLPISEKRLVLMSSWNRLQRLLAFKAVRSFFAAESGTVNFSELLKKNQILVADLSYLPSLESQSLVGTILVNALYNAAKRRPESRRALHFFGVDEYPQFVSTDIKRGLDELRKYGIRLILAHQRLGQLSEDMHNAVITNAKIRFVFGGLPREDAESLARELFTGEVRGNRIKRRNWQTKFRPILQEREVEAYSENESDTDASSDGWSDSYSYGNSSNEGDSRSEREIDSEVDGTDATVTHALSSGSSQQKTNGRSGGKSSSHSVGRGRSRSTAYVTDHEEFKEEGPPQYWPLEEQWERLVSRIVNLDRREALVKIFNNRVLDIVTPDLKQYPSLPRPRRKAGKPKGNGSPIHGTIVPPANDPPEDFHE